MCCSGYCKWEHNDYINGGTRCGKPRGSKCPDEETDDMEEDSYQGDEDGYKLCNYLKAILKL